MANVDILQDPNDPNAKKPGSDTGAAPQAPQAPTGTSDGGGSTSGSHQASTGKTGTGFVNLQNVLAANKQGGQNLGNVIGSGIQQTASGVGQGLGQAQQQFNAQAASGTVGGANDVQNRQNILNKVTAPQQNVTVNATGQGPGAESTQTQVPLVSDADTAAFAKYRGGQYTGPQQLGNYDYLSQQANQAQEQGRNVGSAGGQQALLQQFVGQGQPQYGRGAQSLDQLLLGQGGGNQLAAARQATLGLGNKVQGAEKTAEQQAAYNTALAKQFGTETNNLLGGYGSGTDLTQNKGLIGSSYNDLINKQNAANTANDTEYNSFQDRLKNNQLSMADLEKVAPLVGGMDSSNSLFGLKNADLANAYSEGKYNLSNVADPAAYAKINALNQLAGNPTGAPALDQSQLGKTQNAINTDTSQFSTYADKNKALNTALSPYQLQANQLRYATETNLDPAAQELQTKLNALNQQQFLMPGEEGSQQLDPTARAQAYYDTYKNAAADPRFAEMYTGQPGGGPQLGAQSALQQLLGGFQLGENGRVISGPQETSGEGSVNANPYNANIASLLEGSAHNQLTAANNNISNVRSQQQATDTGLAQLLSPEAREQYYQQNDPYQKFKRTADLFGGVPVSGGKGGQTTTTPYTGK